MVSSEMSPYARVARLTLWVALYLLALQPVAAAESTTNTQLKAYLDSTPPHRIDRIQFCATELSIFGTLAQTDAKAAAPFRIAEILPHQSSADPTGLAQFGANQSRPQRRSVSVHRTFRSSKSLPALKVKRLDSIEAFQYHRWIDHEQEGGLNLGLWTV